MAEEHFDILSQSSQSTVVSHYERPDNSRANTYQSEAQLEKSLIEQLQRQGYEYAQIHTEAQLIANLRRQIQALNGIQFTDAEWKRFFTTELANDAKNIADKAEMIQRAPVLSFQRDDGTTPNIRIIDQVNIHANRTQVINQYEVDGGKHKNRYDVTILVNGLPLVHIELKRRGVAIKEAFNQINRYGRESFWAGSALFEFAQIFIISNGTETKYYSNTTRKSHTDEQGKAPKPGRPRTCNSFEFTSYWADAENRVLNDLEDFTATFLSRHALLNILTRFCVLTEQNILMVMRPYQIAATERLLNTVELSHNARRYGSVDAGGYVWHTTGSGKTLTSFKAAQLAVKLDYIAKVFFVVDRKDLDYQTMKEYDRFQKGAANGNTSTKELTKQIIAGESNKKLIITTIQKLSTFVKKNPQHDIYGKEVVMIFDECHRSQFGEMHRLITKRFKKYYLFGFTGTPIFAENVSAASGIIRTTEDVFGRRLHTYTIVDAIRDHNVLPFRVEYVSTMKEKENIESSEVWDIERESALADPRRIKNVCQYILDHYAQQTKQSKSYAFSVIANVENMARDKRKKVYEIRQDTKVTGFNSLLAVQNIQYAKAYYTQLKELMSAEGFPKNKKLKVATIFSYGVNEQDGEEDESSDDTEGLDKSSRDFLEEAITDYNKTFQTNYDTSADKFPNYYKDVSLRMKNREIDLLIVVNMFLTGFDATTLNTLWVDKNLRYHGLLQAFSRTNRILNSIKTFGNIVCFRNLEDATNKCLALFGDKDAKGVTIIRPFNDYMNGYTDQEGKHVPGYIDYLTMLSKWQPGEHPLGEKAEKEFIQVFGAVLRMRNILTAFDQFATVDPLSERDLQDYTSIYNDLADKYRHLHEHGEKEDICDDVVFEMELVKQVDVGIDYILYLVSLLNEGHQDDIELLAKISRSIDSSTSLRDKKTLIEEFIESLTPDSDVDKDWERFVNDKKRHEFRQIVDEEHLRTPQALEFIEDAFSRGYVPEGGMELDGIMPPINPFDPSADRMGKITAVLDRLKAFFEKYFTITNTSFTEQS